jgi:hypothetical protein
LNAVVSRAVYHGHARKTRGGGRGRRSGWCLATGHLRHAHGESAHPEKVVAVRSSIAKRLLIAAAIAALAIPAGVAVATQPQDPPRPRP